MFLKGWAPSMTSGPFPDSRTSMDSRAYREDLEEEKHSGTGLGQGWAWGSEAQQMKGLYNVQGLELGAGEAPRGFLSGYK